jgi:hypothetical protein
MFQPPVSMPFLLEIPPKINNLTMGDGIPDSSVDEGCISI